MGGRPLWASTCRKVTPLCMCCHPPTNICQLNASLQAVGGMRGIPVSPVLCLRLGTVLCSLLHAK